MQLNTWQVGVVSKANAFPKERLEAVEKKVSQAATLAELSSEYHFYTPAFLYLHLRLMGREPFFDFLDEYRKPVLPISMRFDKPLFKGLDVDDSPAWNHYLYGFEHEHFLPFMTWLGSLTISDVERNFVARVRYREISIADPLKMAKLVVAPADVPTVKLVVFCLDTNRGCYYMEPAKNLLLDLPTARYTRHTFDDTKLFADAVLRGSANPYGDMEAGQVRDGLSVAEQEIRIRVDEERKKKHGGTSPG